MWLAQGPTPMEFVVMMMTESKKKMKYLWKKKNGMTLYNIQI